MNEAIQTTIMGTSYPAPTVDTIDALDVAVEQVKGVSQLISHLAGSAIQAQPEALFAVETVLLAAHSALLTVSAKLSGKVAQ